jgi:hypothetical protein
MLGGRPNPADTVEAIHATATSVERRQRTNLFKSNDIIEISSMRGLIAQMQGEAIYSVAASMVRVSTV